MKCNKFGHQWDVKMKDDDYLYEQCEECGSKKRFCRHDNRQEYAQEHRADTVQLWDKHFQSLYPDTVKQLAETAKDLRDSEDDANQKLEEAKWEFKNLNRTSRFAH